MARLIIRDDGDERELDLSPDEITSIGRDANNTVALEIARGISRRHCQITPVRRDGQPAFELADMGATNKTRVNGKPTDKKLLASGDVIQVGSVEITFDDPQEEERLRDAGRKGVCYLEWVTGGVKGEKVMLDQPRVSMGRRESNTVPLDDRMSSGHHCEITKDLNGYTIRDLGSTNGTLVNGEPTSETQLTHGTRIRIGNSRFVFKDPSMKDIEVELSQFDEDDGWGMMGDIDVTKARGSYAGLLVGLVILAAAGVGGWMISQQAEKDKDSVGGLDISNLVDNGSMDDADFVAWGVDQASEYASVSIKTGGKPGNALHVKNGEEARGPIVAWYQDEFEALATQPFRVEAQFRGGDEGSSLIATWRADNKSISRTVVLAQGGQGWVRVNRVFVKPKWAGGLRLGVVAGPGSSGRVDGVRVTREGEGSLVAVSTPGGPKADAFPSGVIDVVDSVGRGLALGLRPVAKKGGATLSHFVGESVSGSGSTVTVTGAFEDGEDSVPAKVTWSENEEGLVATVECDGASMVGITGGLVRSRVGEIVNVLTPAGARALAASGGQSVDEVKKTLAGNPGQDGGRSSLITFVTTSGSTLEIAAGADASLIDLTHWVSGASGAVNLVTDYTLQKQQAQDALDTARATLRERPGQGIEDLRQVAVEFPFEPAVVKQALDAASGRETRANTDISAMAKALDEFRIYRTDEALAAVVALRDRLSAEFPPRAGGLLEGRVDTLVKSVDSERATYFQEVKGPELNRLEDLAALLAETEGYQPMAVLFLRTIEREFADVQADTPMGRRVAKARDTLASLLAKNPQLAEQVPPMPSSAK